MLNVIEGQEIDMSQVEEDKYMDVVFSNCTITYSLGSHVTVRNSRFIDCNFKQRGSSLNFFPHFARDSFVENSIFNNSSLDHVEIDDMGYPIGNYEIYMFTERDMDEIEEDGLSFENPGQSSSIRSYGEVVKTVKKYNDALDEASDMDSRSRGEIYMVWAFDQFHN